MEAGAGLATEASGGDEVDEDLRSPVALAVDGFELPGDIREYAGCYIKKPLIFGRTLSIEQLIEQLAVVFAD